MVRLTVLIACAAGASALMAPMRPRAWTGRQTTVSAAPEAASLIYAPDETYQMLAAKGKTNSDLSAAKILHSSFMGGLQVGIGGVLCLTACGLLPGVAATNPGFIKLLFGLLFPVCLVLVLNSGTQLYTGNTATMSCAFFEGKIGAKEVARSWALSFIGNVFGCGLMAFVMQYTGILSGGVAAFAAKLGTGKVLGASFGQQLVKGIFCNYLVCMAVFLATQARDMAGRYVGILVPISCFVASGFEHSVANLMLLPAAKLAGSQATVKEMLLKNLLPVTIGNGIAGAILVGASFSYAYGKLGEGK
eukprot:CAMPEP_0119273170 /NCGR_PEP_ID=MMETSP1329-20130426/9751_1 /TAXON_ID=114041 /ORGANISM="Genus nov. species nov., Strain RCC1024" /LENGTH=303 /DNA_ID=CAMNT_0007273349 /DNA_START=116 /DNA_END=1027 /DNA_ORIENTATION=-